MSRNLSLAAVALLLPLSAQAWQENPTPQQAIAMQQYMRTTPYIDLPADVLAKAVVELNGLKSEATPTDLDGVLQKTGEMLNTQLPRVPHLVAREDIAEETKPSAAVGATISGYSTPAAGRSGSSVQAPTVTGSSYVVGDFHHYDYLVRAVPEDGGITLEEARQQVGVTKAPKGSGFASLWLIFAPSKRSESTFRYLGTQKVDGHKAHVVAFAQIPDKVRKPAMLDTGAGNIPLIYQGFAWIDEQDFHILRMRTDLRAPLPELNLKRVTSIVDFSKASIPDFKETLWLPSKVEVLWQTNEVEAGEIHRYSKYHLYQASIKIMQFADR